VLVERDQSLIDAQAAFEADKNRNGNGE
jgi:hypothetical protein